LVSNGSPPSLKGLQEPLMRCWPPAMSGAEANSRDRLNIIGDS
jgi:hypothetical protein